MPEMKPQGRYVPVGSNGDSVLPFAVNAHRIGVLTIALDTALEKKKIPIGGTFLWAVTATDNGVLASIAFKPDAGDNSIPFRKGTSISGAHFKEIYVTATAQAGKTITFVYLVEENPEGFRITNPGESTTTVDPTKSTTATQSRVTVGAASAALLASDGTRRRAVLINLSPTETIWYRDDSAAATTANGIPLRPGNEREWLSTDGINAIRGGAVDADIAIQIEQD